FVSAEQISEAFANPKLKVFTNSEEFKAALAAMNLDNSALLLMSSGNYGGLDLEALKEQISVK
ncbi:MAG: peptidoglycan synthetase, partial [Salegentibacter sp.]